MRRLLSLSYLALAAAVAAAAPADAPERGALGIAGDAFTLDGMRTFLLGASYYAGLGAGEATVRRDLDGLRRHGFRWVRVWATWPAFDADVSAVDAGGGPREPYLGRLDRLLALAAERGMAVDVTLTRGRPPGRVESLDSHRRAVETIVGRLRGRRNWYLDLANERNIRDDRYVPFPELRALRDAAKRLSPALIVTASHGGDIDRDELREYLETARVDFIAPHRPRTPASPGGTGARTRTYLEWLRDLGRIVPVHYQEPFRRGYAEWEPDAAAFLADLREARLAGAAGWCLHNGSTRSAPDGRPRRSFDLRAEGLLTQLDAEERKVLEAAAGL